MKDKELLIVALAVVLSVAAFLFSAYATSNNAAYWWDEAEYGVLSKGMSSPEGFFGFFGDRSYRPPFVPLFIAMFRALFGEIAWAVLTPVFSGLSILAVFVIGRRFFDWKAGAIAAVMMLFSSLFVFYSGRLLTEIPGIFFSSLAAFFLFNALETGKRRDYLLLSIFTLCAFLVFYRFLMFLAAMGLFALAFRFRSLVRDYLNVAYAALVFLIFIFPLFLYSHVNFGSFYGLFTSSYFGQAPEPIEYFAVLVGHVFSNGLVVALLLLSVPYAFLYGKREMRFLAAMNVLLFITASVLLNHKEDRYLMPMFPVAFLAIGAFSSEVLSSALNKLRNFRFEGERMEASAILLLLGIINLFCLYYGTFGNIGSAMALYEGRKASFGDVKDAALYVRDNTAPSETLLTDSVVAMFYSDRVSHGFSGSNISLFLEYFERYSPSYVLMTAYESRDSYISAINNMNNIKTPSNSVEYIFFHKEKFTIEAVFPSQQAANVMVVRVNR